MPQLVECCLLPLNIFDFKVVPLLIVQQSCCNSTVMVPCRLLSSWQCQIAGSVASEKLFLSQTFFVLQTFITCSKARASAMLVPPIEQWCCCAMMLPHCFCWLAGTVHWWLIVVFKILFQYWDPVTDTITISMARATILLPLVQDAVSIACLCLLVATISAGWLFLK